MKQNLGHSFTRKLLDDVLRTIYIFTMTFSHFTFECPLCLCSVHNHTGMANIL